MIRPERGPAAQSGDLPWQAVTATRFRSWPIMKKLINVAAAAVVAAGVLTGSQAVAAAAQPTGQAAAKCTNLVVTGKTVAVRRPPNDENATPNSPVDHYVHKGDRLRSCVMTFNRGGNSYFKCGRSGSDWYLVRGGQIPETCVRKV
ncbi:hypothetical protein [Streptomyces sp. NPDC059009]|uniref:hypothetical protein n=1 Tax=Streptomyces sp. NPDC059009 TaxID=3346694 RepID=UPI0036CEB085